MDWQLAFNSLATTFGVLGAGLIKVIWSSIQGVRADVTKMQTVMPETYVRRDDFKDFMRSFADQLKRIEDKLDDKVDRA